LDPIPASTVTFVLTAKGVRYFTGLGNDFNPGGIARTAVVKLREPTRRNLLQVTGIMGGQAKDSEAIVEFTWQVPIVRNQYSGRAQFTQYDDGWRIQSLSAEVTGFQDLLFNALPEPSAANIATAEAAARDAAAEERRASQAQQETANSAVNERIAKTPTRTVATFDFVYRSRSLMDNSVQQKVTKLILTNASIEIRFPSGPPRVMGLWQISDIRLGRDNSGRPGVSITENCSMCTGTGAYQDANGSLSLPDVVRTLQTAVAAWNRRYPDRRTWAPAEAPEVADAVPARPGRGTQATPADDGRVDLDRHCRSVGYLRAENLDGTGYGWKCMPGRGTISVESACKQQYGANFSASLVSPPPGRPGDWRCKAR